MIVHVNGSRRRLKSRLTHLSSWQRLRNAVAKGLAFSTRCCRTKSDKKGKDANNGFDIDIHLVNDGEAYKLGDINWLLILVRYLLNSIEEIKK